MAGLDSATARYLERPWLQSNLIDWYILNGFILDELLRLTYATRSGLVFGETDWAYLFSRGKNESWALWRFGLSAAKFALNWLLLPALAVIAYYLERFSAMRWILGGFGGLVLLQLSSLPGRLMRSRARKRSLAELEDKYSRLFRLRQSTNVSTVNPNSLREQLKMAVEDDLILRPAIHSIVDRALVRDPAVLTVPAAAIF